MRKKNYKGRGEKRSLPKCDGVCRTYDPIQLRYAEMLEDNGMVAGFRCNVPLEGLEIGEYTTDFVCTIEGRRATGARARPAEVPHEADDREASRRLAGILGELGVTDWGIVTNAEE